MRLVDSHCHLQADRFGGDVDLVIGAARLAGVERILVPGWDVASSERALDLVGRFPWLEAAVGVHPHDAAAVDEAGWERVVELAADSRVVAIGETGLDYDRMFSPIEAQLAEPPPQPGPRPSDRKAGHHPLPIEGRGTGRPGRPPRGTGPGRDRFGERSASVRPAAIIHSYSGPLDYGEAVVALGLAVSFSGLVFRAGEEASADVVRLVPADRLLVETDSPFLSPPGAPRKRNEPEWVAVTARWVAERRGVELDALGDDLVAAYDAVARPERPSPPT